MRLEKLRVIDDSNIPSRAKIKDALVEIPDDILLKIISDYNEANGLAPIYKATEENIEKLKEEGKEVPSNAEDNFAFLTPNSYGGTEGFNNLQEKIDYDSELVPFVEANFTTYQNDLPAIVEQENNLPKLNEEIEIKDDVEEGIYNEEWLKANWKKAKMSKVSRYNNILQLAEKVKNDDLELYKKILEIAKKYNANSDVYTYNLAKADLFKIFKENVKEEANEEVSEADKSEKRKQAMNAYNARYNEKISEWKKMPESWRNKLEPLIESGRFETFKKVLVELAETDEQKNAREGKTDETLMKRFEEIYKFIYSDDNLRNFAAKKDLENPEEFVDCFKTTLSKFKSKEITFEQVLKFFQSVKDYPSKYLDASEDWYSPTISESEKETKARKENERERKSDLESKTGGESAKEMKAKIEEKAKIILASNNEEWINYWKENLEVEKKAYKKGEQDLDEYLEEVLDLAEYVVGKVKPSDKEKSESEYEDEVKELIGSIEETLSSTPKDGFNAFYEELKKNKEIKDQYIVLLKIEKLLRKDNDVDTNLVALGNEDKCKKFFEELAKNKKPEDIYNELKEA